MLLRAAKESVDEVSLAAGRARSALWSAVRRRDFRGSGLFDRQRSLPHPSCDAKPFRKYYLKEWTFDDEPTPGGAYERMVQRRIFSSDGIPRRIVARFTVRSGQLARVSIVLEERRKDCEGQVIRFDDAHGRFHRHEPGWPLPGGIEAYLDSVDPRLRIEFARREIALRYPEYEAALFGKDIP